MAVAVLFAQVPPDPASPRKSASPCVGVRAASAGLVVKPDSLSD